MGQIMQWMTIDSAPKDGKIILAIEKEGPVLIQWEKGHFCDGFWRDQDHYVHTNVTHWMPIPLLPKADECHK